MTTKKDKRSSHDAPDKRQIRTMGDAVKELVGEGEGDGEASRNVRSRPTHLRQRVGTQRSRDVQTSSGQEVRKPRKKTHTENATASARESSRVRTMRDAVNEMRIYGEDQANRGDTSENQQRPHKMRTRPKMGRKISERLFGSKKLRRDREKPLTIMGMRISFWPMFILMFVVIMLTAMLMNGSNLVVKQEKLTVMGLSSDLENYRILVLSDLNGKRFGDKQITLLRQIESLSYDIVVCLGDMVGNGGDPTPFYELLDGLPSSKQVYFICGDSDPGPYVQRVRGENAPLSELVLEDWILGAIERGAIYVDRPTLITVGEARLWLSPSDMLNVEAAETVSIWKEQVSQEESGYLAGIQVDTQTLPFTTYRFQRAQALLDAVNSMLDTDLHISLSHVPISDDYIDAVGTHTSEDGKYLPSPDIALAGHYCGGVWNLPLIGAFYVPDSTLERYGWFPDQERVSGIRQVDDTQVYVSRGLSTCGDVPIMPIRILNNPEISVLTLTATLPSSMLE